MKKEQIKKLTSLFFEAGSLRKIPRSHQQTLLTQDLSDNIASHSYRVAVIGYFLSQNIEEVDSGKVVKMCLFHDLEETRTGDQNWVHKSYIKSFEDEVRKDQVKDIKNNDNFKEISKEYDERKSLESKVAKDADILDQLLLLREYEWQGNQEAKKWLDKKEEGGYKNFSTSLAKEIAKEIKKQKPSSWWKDAWSAHRRK